MRLGTLARKINITPTTLTNFLTKKEVVLSSGTNTKLSTDHVDLILKHFKKSIPEEPIAEEVQIIEPPIVEVPNPEPIIKEAPIQEPTLEENLPKEESEIIIDEQAQEITTEKKPTESIEKDPEPVVLSAEIVLEDTIKQETTKTVKTTLEETDKEETTKKPAINLTDAFVEIALPHEIEPVSALNDPKIQEEVVIEPQLEQQEDIEVIPAVAIPIEETPKSTLAIDPEIESEVERAAYDDSITIIKSKKVELQGLTVKGKIDLPEPKAKEEKKIEATKKAYDPNEIVTTSGPSRERRKPKNYKGKKYNNDYNPLKAAKKKEIWEEKKKKEAEEKKKKAIKAAHYSKKSQKKKPLAEPKKKTKKITKKKKVEVFEGNVFQKFWKWMNT